MSLYNYCIFIQRLALHNALSMPNALNVFLSASLICPSQFGSCPSKCHMQQAGNLSRTPKHFLTWIIFGRA